MFLLTVESHFSAAHHLPGCPGKCAQIHGHRWVVRAGFETSDIGKDGITYDFSHLKSRLDNICSIYDHQNLNDFFEHPTAEILAETIFTLLNDYLPHTEWVEVCESPGTSARYTP